MVSKVQFISISQVLFYFPSHIFSGSSRRRGVTYEILGCYKWNFEGKSTQDGNRVKLNQDHLYHEQQVTMNSSLCFHTEQHKG